MSGTRFLWDRFCRNLEQIVERSMRYKGLLAMVSVCGGRVRECVNGFIIDDSIEARRLFVFSERESSDGSNVW